MLLLAENSEKMDIFAKRWPRLFSAPRTPSAFRASLRTLVPLYVDFLRSETAVQNYNAPTQGRRLAPCKSHTIKKVAHIRQTIRPKLIE